MAGNEKYGENDENNNTPTSLRIGWRENSKHQTRAEKKSLRCQLECRRKDRDDDACDRDDGDSAMCMCIPNPNVFANARKRSAKNELRLKFKRHHVRRKKCVIFPVFHFKQSTCLRKIDGLDSNEAFETVSPFRYCFWIRLAFSHRIATVCSTYSTIDWHQFV